MMARQYSTCDTIIGIAQLYQKSGCQDVRMYDDINKPGISINLTDSLCCVTCHIVTVLFFRCMAFAQQKSKEKGHKVEPEPPPPEAHSSVGKELQKVQKVCTKKGFKRPQKA